MDIGPLEYVVIGFQDDHFTNEILPELNAIQASNLIRVVDLLFVSKDADGTVTIREVSELNEEEQIVANWRSFNCSASYMTTVH